MIVLVIQFSASASEILAAALQDYGRALIVGGDHTHGKGTVQAMLDMNRNLPLLRLQDYEDLGALKLTIQKFYRISGGSTQYKGVEPDLVVPSLLDYLESGEKYMDYSLPWDQVGAVDFEPWQGYRFDVAKARREGGKWAADNPLFDKIREETAKAKARSEETTLPVSLQGMWQDREELAATRKEAQAIGLLQEGEEEGAAAPEEKKPLEETLGTDPVVQVSLFLMRDLPRPGRRIGLSQ